MKILTAMAIVGLCTASISAQHNMTHDATMTMNAAVTKAIVVLSPTQGHNVTGTITFTSVDGGVKIEGHLSGLTPGKHGFHIHQYGDCSAPDGTSAGGHFQPSGHTHGAPTVVQRHDGDLGNVIADSLGNAEYLWTDSKLELNGPNSIIGLAVIVHASEDDLKTQPTGNAGARVACGVIGIAKP